MPCWSWRGSVMSAAMIRLARAVAGQGAKLDVLGSTSTLRLLSSLSYQPSAELLNQEPCEWCMLAKEDSLLHLISM